MPKSVPKIHLAEKGGETGNSSYAEVESNNATAKGYSQAPFAVQAEAVFKLHAGFPNNESVLRN